MYTADGSEGTEVTIPLPFTRTNTNYSIFMTNTTTGSFVYNIPSGSRTTTNFKVVLTTAISNGEALDFLLVQHGGTADSISLSGTVNARFVNLTGSLISSVTTLSGTVDARFINLTGSLISGLANLSGTINARFANFSGGGGGYLGKGVGAATFAAGSLVKRGPFLFGTFSGSSVDPLIVEGRLGDANDWFITGSVPGGAFQSGTIAVLNNNNTGRDSGVFRKSTNTGINNVRLICDALIGPNGAADALTIGIMNSSEGYSTTASGLRGMTGALGVEIDVWNNSSAGTRFAPFQTSSAGPYIQIGATSNVDGLAPIEGTKYFRYYLDFKANGAGTHLTMSLSRDSWDNLTAATYDRPGFIAEWIVSKPAWISDVNTVTWRSAVGCWSGGVAAIFKVRSFFVQRTVPEWDLVSILPHAPRIDWGLF